MITAVVCVVVITAVSVAIGIALGKFAGFGNNTDEYEDQWTRLPHPD